MAATDSIRKALESTMFRSLGALVARLLLGLPFVIFGVMKYANMGRMTAYIEKGGLPGEMIYLVIPFQILCGLGVWLGAATRWAAFLLGGFCLVAASLYHNNLADPGELAFFTKDFATAGGFYFLWQSGPGRWSIDGWLQRLD